MMPRGTGIPVLQARGLRSTDVPCELCHAHLIIAVDYAIRHVRSFCLAEFRRPPDAKT